MKGRILDYSIQESKGLISGDDGNRYEFVNAEWKEDKAPAKNLIVDFEIDGKFAKRIYLASSQIFNTDNIKEKVSQIGSSNTLKNAQFNIIETLTAGIHNKLGFFVSLFLAFSLFLPVIHIRLHGFSNYGFIDYVVLIKEDWGILMLPIILITAFHFYTGGNHQSVKTTALIFVSLIFVQFINLYNLYGRGAGIFGHYALRKDENFFDMLRFEAYIIILAILLLLYASFIKTYKEKVSVNKN